MPRGFTDGPYEIYSYPQMKKLLACSTLRLAKSEVRSRQRVWDTDVIIKNGWGEEVCVITKSKQKEK